MCKTQCVYHSIIRFWLRWQWFQLLYQAQCWAFQQVCLPDGKVQRMGALLPRHHQVAHKRESENQFFTKVERLLHVYCNHLCRSRVKQVLQSSPSTINDHLTQGRSSKEVQWEKWRSKLEKLLQKFQKMILADECWRSSGFCVTVSPSSKLFYMKVICFLHCLCNGNDKC